MCLICKYFIVAIGIAILCITLLFVTLWSETFTRDTIKHSKIFRVISNEIPVLLFILYWCYFSCLELYSCKFFNAYFYDQMLFEIFAAKWDKFANLHKQTFIFLGGHGFNISIHKYFWEEWEQIYQFSRKTKLTEGNSAAVYFP